MTPEQAAGIVDALPMPVLLIGAGGRVEAANAAAEAFFGTSAAVLRRQRADDLFAVGSPVAALIKTARAGGSTVSENDLGIATNAGAEERRADIHVGPVGDGRGGLVLVLKERTIAEKLGRQLTHRTAARSVSALSAILAHEIKNPLSGIRGAAQLLESSVPEEDRLLTGLIRDETDRIVRLVDRMEMFSDARPLVGEPLNIHVVLDHVKRIAQSGFARGLAFTEHYDPSLPPVHGDRDQLVQVFLNLIKNAAEAIGEQPDGEIVLSTAFRPGLRVATATSRDRVGLPLEIGVRDNGPGVPGDLLPRLFDPFVTTKPNGTGLGLALVAKIIGDHGGTITCESQPRRTTFLVNLPMVRARPRAQP